MSKNKPAAKKNTPYEGREAKPTCTRMGHAQDQPQHSVASKATSLAPQQTTTMR
jgi:hypothetical protein